MGEVKNRQYQSRPLGPEDVKCKISHCGICGSDIHTLESGWGPTSYPCVMGHEVVGEVTLTRANVKRFAVGNRVVVGAQVLACLNKNPDTLCRDCADREDYLCDNAIYTYMGAYVMGARQHSVRRRGTSFVAGVTVFTPLKQEGVKAGDRVGVIGIRGLGHLPIQFIRAQGAVPIAFSRSANKEQEDLSFGAEEFYNLSDKAGQETAVNSVDVLILTADANNMPYNLYLSLLLKRGTLILLGIPNDDVKVSPLFVMRALRVHGSLIGSIADVKDMPELASKKNAPGHSETAMSKVNEGLDMVREGGVRYRIVLEN